MVVAVVLAFSPAATAAAPPTVAATATVTSGAAPLDVVLTASGDAASYHWDFGDRAVAEGGQGRARLPSRRLHGPGDWNERNR